MPALILELIHGLEMQCKILYNARHGHVIINSAWLQKTALSMNCITIYPHLYYCHIL